MSKSYSSKRPSNTRPNWSGVLATGDRSKVVDPKTGRVRSNVQVHGYVTKNHASTIVTKHKSFSGKSYLKYEGATHSLPKNTQAALAYALDNSENDKAYIYDELPAVKKDKGLGI